ncbi:hypothetical protein K9L97_05940 [Candidatus Woesearchaeota archaeon]|nr:hypothetical protein [Candidatus Woesearchaeota archaeon]
MSSLKLKTLGYFLFYLSLSLLFVPSLCYASNEASVSVVPATGDLTASIPIMKIPSVNSESYEVYLSYISGGGVKVGQPSTWVGLGWSLDSGSVTRTVKNIPDDLDARVGGAYLDDEVFSTHYDANIETFDDSRSFWEVYATVIISIIFAAIISFVSFGSGSGAGWSIVVAAIESTLVSAMANAIVMSMNNLNPIDAFKSTLGDVLMNYLSMTLTSSIREFAGTVAALAHIADFVDGYVKPFQTVKAGYMAIVSLSANTKTEWSSGGFSKNYRKTQKRSGFFYADYDSERLIHEPPIILDGQSPDTYAVSGPVSGELIPVNFNADMSSGSNFRPDTLGISDPTTSKIENRVKFYLKNLGGFEELKVEFSSDLSDSCSDSLNGNELDAGICNTRSYQRYIDQWIFTNPDGTRFVYGSPDVPGSILREHKGQTQSYKYRRYQEGVEGEAWRKSFSYTHHPVEWKIISILGPNYEGDSLYPLDASNPKGHWIAFEYDSLYNGANCAFIEGDFYGNGSIDFYGDPYYSMRLVDVSYLKKIQTPVSVAEFFYSNRADGRESLPTPQDFSEQVIGLNPVDDKVGILAMNYLNYKADIFETYAQISDISDLECYKTSSSPSEDFHYKQKLNRIDLKNKDAEDVLSKVYFNRNVDPYYQYLLQRNVEESGNPSKGYGKYTLKEVQQCNLLNREEYCKDPYIFDYYNDWS